MTEAPWTTIRLVGLDESGTMDAYLVAVAEDEQGEGRSLTFQCSVDEPDDQDRALGLDSYCTVTEYAATYYGGIRSVTLHGQVFTVEFTEAATAELELSTSTLRWELDVPGAQRDALIRGLRRVLTYGDPAQHPDLDLT